MLLVTQSTGCVLDTHVWHSCTDGRISLQESSSSDTNSDSAARTAVRTDTVQASARICRRSHLRDVRRRLHVIPG